MKDWIRRLIDNGFRDLEGLSVDAVIPVNESVVNDAIAETLKDLSTTQTATDWTRFAAFVQSAEVSVPGRVITLKLKIRI